MDMSDLTPLAEGSGYNTRHQNASTAGPARAPYDIQSEALSGVEEEVLVPPSIVLPSVDDPSTVMISQDPVFNPQLGQSGSQQVQQQQSLSGEASCDEVSDTVLVIFAVILILALKWAIQAFGLYYAHNRVISPVFGASQMKFSQAFLLIIALSIVLGLNMQRIVYMCPYLNKQKIDL